MNESHQGMESRTDAFIEELIPLGSFDSAAIASILLACRAALRDGRIADIERIVWLYHDSLQENHPNRSRVSVN
jgi:hypothetical protein